MSEEVKPSPRSIELARLAMKIILLSGDDDRIDNLALLFELARAEGATEANNQMTRTLNAPITAEDLGVHVT